MKKINLFLSILIFIVAFFVLYLVLVRSGEGAASQEQSEIVDAFDLPNQFLITYLPREEGNLVRMEVWYYPEQSMKITFLEGKVFSTEDFSTDEVPAKTTLVPWDYDYNSSIASLKKTLGENIETLDFLPEFYEKGEFEGYISDEAIFVLEQGKLTYFQTIGLSK